MKIGLTGSIGVGKSLVFSYVKDILSNDADYIDADEITNEMYKKKDVLDKLYQMFGTNDKKEIGKIVFNDEKELKKINNYMHEIIINEIKKRMDESDKKYIIVDIPLLYELKLENLFDEVIVVYADKKTQLKRIMLRDNLIKDEALKRIKSQISIEDKVKRTNNVIKNIGKKEETYNQVREILSKIIVGKGK